MENLFELLPIAMSVNLPANVTELRLRAGRPLYVCDGLTWGFTGGYTVTQTDIDYVLGKASGYSVYSVADNLVRGYLTYKGGIRIGASGEGVSDGDRLKALKRFSSLTIRVPREIKGMAGEIVSKIFAEGKIRNTLVISPTASGKTTLLREIARSASERGFNTAVIDERYELASVYDGVPTLDVGLTTDVLSGVPKLTAYEMLIRSMNPDVIITDEIYGEREVLAVADAVRAGVKIAASLHAESTSGLSDTVYGKLLELADVIVVLSKTPRAGTIISVEVKC